MLNMPWELPKEYKRTKEAKGLYRYYVNNKLIFSIGKRSEVSNVLGTAQLSDWVWDWGTGWIGLGIKGGGLKFAEEKLKDSLETDVTWYGNNLVRREPSGTRTLSQEEADKWYSTRDKALVILGYIRPCT